MLNVACPFICEQMYQNFKNEFGFEEESINLVKWPVQNDSLIDLELEAKMQAAKTTIQAILAAREKAQLGVRWPLKQAIIVTKDEATITATEDLSDLIKTQTNVKELNVQQSFTHVDISIKADAGAIGREFGSLSPQIIVKISQDSQETILSHIEEKGKYVMNVDGQDIDLKKNHLIIEREVQHPYKEAESKTGFVYINVERTEELENEGFARELIRRVQIQRKEAGMQKEDKIQLYIGTDNAGLLNFEKQISERTGAESLTISNEGFDKEYSIKTEEKIKDTVFLLALNKL